MYFYDGSPQVKTKDQYKSNGQNIHIHTGKEATLEYEKGSSHVKK